MYENSGDEQNLKIRKSIHTTLLQISLRRNLAPVAQILPDWSTFGRQEPESTIRDRLPKFRIANSEDGSAPVFNF